MSTAVIAKQNAKFQQLVTKLREIFQIDRPELDFGIYRILNTRADEINDYLENRLAEKVQAALALGNAANTQQLQIELQEAEKNAHALGVSPDGVPKVQELRNKLKAITTGYGEHENAVFSHLLTFFSRYYDNGDFISQRRYKGDTYAIPYAGEEVMLHWANKDQYYTKSGENFANYSFKLPSEDGQSGRTVHLRLVSADTAKDNRKDNDKDRRFALVEQKTVTRMDELGDEYEEQLLPVEEVNGSSGKELIVRFEYKAVAKGTKQDALVQKAVAAVLSDAAVKARWLDLSSRSPTEKNPQRTLLEKHLVDYTTKNTADYFIHKNLGDFLRRELDFYVKSEAMHLDDVQNASAFADIEKSLRMIQCLRSIALELIVFLAQLEDFQKKLWLKKKFVVSSHYCITFDRIFDIGAGVQNVEEKAKVIAIRGQLIADILANERQWERWKQLGLWDGEATGTLEDLKARPYRMVDTTLFEIDFKRRLQAAIEEIDTHLGGLLVHADNFQGVNLLEASWRQTISGIYIDPPYNTDASPIVYKNGYQHSSWASLFTGRMTTALRLLSPDGMICVAIDDFEYSQQYLMMSGVLGLQHSGTAVVRSKPQGRPTASGFSANHEYAVFWSPVEKPVIGRLPRVGSKAERYPNTDEKGIYSWANFRKSGTDSDRSDRKKSFYPVYVQDKSARVPAMSWSSEQEQWIVEEEVVPNETAVWPIDSNGNEKVWTCSVARLRTELDDLKVVRSDNGPIELQKKYRPNQDGALPGTWWDRPEYSASESGTKVLKDQFKAKDFDFPKSINLVVDNLRVLNIKDGNTVLDYFAGSGTTGCATIALNREDGGGRKYILIEQGEYFETVLKPRVQKVIFSADWANGIPTAPDTGISHCFKIIKLESYEDTLNNLQLRRDAKQGETLSLLNQQTQDDYLLNYMLDVESRDSLLSVQDFKKPFDYTLNVAVDSAGAFEPRNIDLVETFNYLIGLRVRHVDAQPERGFLTVTGMLPSGESCLVLWRDCEILNYEGVSKLCDRLAINPADNEFDVVYINGDHNIPTVLTQTAEEGGATRVLKLRQIEPEFLQRMFSAEDI
ncbi:DNA methyltransferase [Pseudomonas corrugata]|uniref:DNA methyltransferase n=1 Tax=Pseudomonas corrugata TaxID=47879 RepID=UPI0006D8AABB|nr:DNA methyltransferase [Pseudomonas corrugata]